MNSKNSIKVLLNMSMDNAILVSTMIGNIVCVCVMFVLLLVFVVSDIWLVRRIDKYAKEYFSK